MTQEVLILGGAEPLRPTEPLTVFRFRIRLQSQPRISIVVGDEKCYGKIARWLALDKVNSTYVFDYVTVADFSKSSSSALLSIYNGDELLAEFDCDVGNDLLSTIASIRDGRAANREWLLSRFRCTNCSHEAPVVENASILECSKCGTEFRQTGPSVRTVAPDLFPGTPENVSWHEYTSGLEGRIDQVLRSGGTVLDVGCGFKTKFKRGVVGLDIFEYPYVDLVAFAENLPVANDSFDLVVSLSVFEHLRNPQAAGAEIERVLKPGGQLYSIVPFVFPLHGHPSHYYNMTLEGVKNLFSDQMALERVSYGHPIKAIKDLCVRYMQGLPENVRPDFGNMRIADLVENPLPLDREVVTELSTKTIEQIPRGTRCWFRKRTQ